MFKIGEFSKLTQVTIRMLRYYDETGLLKPAHIDPWTGYRMYSANQIPVLNRIIFLRDSGFNVAEIADVLAANDTQFLIRQLDNKYAETEQAIRTAQDRLRKIELAKQEIGSSEITNVEKSSMHYNVTLKCIPCCQVLSLRRTVPDYYAEGGLWQELSAFAEQQRVQLSGDSFTIYHDMEYKETDIDMELCAPVKIPGKSTGGFIYRNTEPIPVMACTMVYGAFSRIAGAYLNFAEWLEKNHRYNTCGPTRQIVHRGPWNETNPEQYLTEIQIPLEKCP